MDPAFPILVTTHAMEELLRRGLSLESVLEVVRRPHQVVPGRWKREIRQSLTVSEQGKTILLRVVVEWQDRELLVITCYRTSKIDKYWLAR